MAAEKAGRKIAVEVKSFINRSQVDDLENALGQYLLYRSLLKRREPDRTIFLAIPLRVFDGILSSPLGHVALEDYSLRLIVFDQHHEVIDQWINFQNIDKS